MHFGQGRGERRELCAEKCVGVHVPDELLEIVHLISEKGSFLMEKQTFWKSDVKLSP